MCLLPFLWLYLVLSLVVLLVLVPILRRPLALGLLSIDPRVRMYFVSTCQPARCFFVAKPSNTSSRQNVCSLFSGSREEKKGREKRYPSPSSFLISTSPWCHDAQLLLCFAVEFCHRFAMFLVFPSNERQKCHLARCYWTSLHQFGLGTRRHFSAIVAD